MENLPQIQTIIQDYTPPISTVIDAPWVQVMSVNGGVGDVKVASEYIPGQAYTKYQLVGYNGGLYFAKVDNRDNVFTASNWEEIPTMSKINALLGAK